MGQRSVTTYLLLCLGLFPAWAGPAAETTEQHWVRGQEALRRGEYGAAIDHWERTAQGWAGAGQTNRQFEALHALGSICQMAGQLHRAQEVLKAMEALADTSAEHAAVSELAGTFAMLKGNYTAARVRFSEALALADEIDAPRLTASLRNNLGNVEVAEGRDREAWRFYVQAERSAQRGKDAALLVRVVVNGCRIGARLGERAVVERMMRAAEIELRAWEPSHSRAQMYLSLAGALQGGGSSETDRAFYLTNRARLIQEGYTTAKQAGDERGQSLALGMLAQQYVIDGQRLAAAPLFDRAVFHAQRAAAADLHYRWLWGLARCRRDAGEDAVALTRYREAVTSLRAVRYDLVGGLGNLPAAGSFREAVGDLYGELADLLLRAAANEPVRERAEQLLREARQTQEQLRSAELEDYFRDECVSIVLGQSRPVDQIAERTAVVYVIPLADRSELLVSLPGERIERFGVSVPGAELEGELRSFRALLEKRTTYEYLRQAQQLHAWLVAPMVRVLEENAVDTLVLVPEGALQLVPLAALHDGEQYLIERFALAITPGLSLLGSQPLESNRRPRLLAAGLSVPAQGFAGLAHVPQELDYLHKKTGGTVMLDEQFTTARLAKVFRDDSFSIVHLASHGRIEARAQGTFLATYDGRLTFDQLEQFIKPSQYRGQPVELLGLSACQTASEDARSGLGLAGVALKAGARSALATLWSVNDEASSLLVRNFYDQLLQPNGPTKANSLRQAQLRLLADPRYSHPAYWSPYLIIGNWL